VINPHSISLTKLLSDINSAISGEVSENPAKIEISSQEIEDTSSAEIQIESETIETALQPNDKVSDELIASREIPLPTEPEKQEKQPLKLSPQGVVKETLKIETERLDRLVDMIGELVIAESMVTQDAEIVEKATARVTRNLAHLNKITRELQEIGMSLRMMPVRPVFERMARLARDLAKKSKKKIEFSMFGEDTEVDKGMVDRISDPLTHMLSTQRHKSSMSF